MTIKKINLCRDLFQAIKNIELEQREKINPVIEIDVESLQSHFDTCPICQTEIKKLINPSNIFNLMKGLPLWLK